MSETSGGPSLEPGSQVLVSTGRDTNVVRNLPDSTTRAVIVAIRSTPDEVDEALKARGIDPRNAVVIPVGLDDPTYRGFLEVTGVVRPSNLAHLGRTISDRLQAGNGGGDWLVIDDLIVLLMYNGDERFLRFLRSIARRVRIDGIKAIYGIERAAVSAETFNAIAAICEYHVDLTAD